MKTISSKQKKLAEILKELERNSEITEAALVSTKGQVMSAQLDKETDEKAIAAMSATLSSVGNRVAGVLKSGNISAINLHGSQSIIILHQLDSAVLIATAPADAKIGLIDYELANACKKIEEYL